MSNWKLFRLSLANHPGLTVGWMWPALLAVAMLVRGDAPPLIFWLTVFPAFSALPWIPILCTAWTMRKQHAEEFSHD